MEALTLSVALAAVVIVLASRPVYGLVAYLAVMLLYPDYLRVSLGTVDISACRIIVTVLLIRCVVDAGVMSRFHWKPLDTLVALSMIVYAVTLSFTTSFDVWIENRAGFVMDTFFAYLAVRFVIVDRPSFVTVAKAAALMTALLAVHGVAETFTGWSLYQGLGQYCPFAHTKGMEYQTRFDLNRAMGPTGETILFGLSFASVIPVIWMLRHEAPPWNRRAYVLTICGIVGVLSTVSSGPYMALIVVLVCLSLEYAKSLVKPLIVFLVLGCLAVEMISNRHFYYVLADFTMDSDSGWYRARLIDVAIRRLPEYWLYGYGLGDPGWGPDINELPRTDIVNDFVCCAAQHGLIALAVYIGILACAMGGVARVSAHASAWHRSCCWALGSSLVAILTASWSVSLFGQMTTVFYALLGLNGAAPWLAVCDHRRRLLTPAAAGTLKRPVGATRFRF